MTDETFPGSCLRCKVPVIVRTVILLVCLLSLLMILMSKGTHPAKLLPSRAVSNPAPRIMPPIVAPVRVPRLTNAPEQVVVRISEKTPVQQINEPEGEVKPEEMKREEIVSPLHSALLRHLSEQNTFPPALEKFHIVNGRNSRSGIQIGYGRLSAKDFPITKISSGSHPEEPGCIYIKTSFSF